MKIALAQLNATVGDIDGNTNNIIHAYAQADAQGADLVIFNELAITGYPPKDLLLKPSFVRRNIAALETLALKLNGKAAALVGFVDTNASPDGVPLHNAAALLHGGKRVAVAHKSLLPTYDVFDEHRYFEPAKECTIVDVPLAGKSRRIAITICEDLWTDDECFSGRRYHRRPIDEIAQRGADLVVNLSASPFVIDKQAFRQKMLAGHARKVGCPVMLCNQVGGNDELIFDGGSFVVAADGTLTHRTRAFETDILVADLDSNEKLIADYPESLASVNDALVLGTRDYVRKCGFENVVIGLSGGIDSAVTCAIAAEALGADKVLGVALPSRYSSDHSVSDAESLAKQLGVEFQEIAIRDIHAAAEETLTPHFGDRPPDVTEENMQARVRGLLLMSLSNKFGRLLLTTGNKSELSVGYCTLYGDMCGGLAVISDVPKIMVYDLARWMNERAGREIIPESTITKPPSAELRPDQHDQQSLPPYDVLDGILRRYIELEMSVDEIVTDGFDAETVRDIARKVDQNEYKRKQMATGLKVTSRAFGVGRRMPIAARFQY